MGRALSTSPWQRTVAVRDATSRAGRLLAASGGVVGDAVRHGAGDTGETRRFVRGTPRAPGPPRSGPARHAVSGTRRPPGDRALGGRSGRAAVVRVGYLDSTRPTGVALSASTAVARGQAGSRGYSSLRR
ncbi:hypothetical protein Sdagh_21730 [Streptomyces daghestanicus]|uniref:Uncharacterized protein n=1 Tax=Streptomyces daghestanicus TaxID=66885 RepID=A0ABQ3PZK3_9ACTN|nr:hypothetical protein GCM10010240_62030 [Streptomyces griseoviridis]GHI30443.1 hypothetical protein Sdagh_21730 [Streptomyces daghestanicus]